MKSRLQPLSKLKSAVKKHPSLLKVAAYPVRFVSRGQTKLFPWNLNFELTTRCDSRCVYCPREKVIKKGIKNVGDMDFNIIQRTVQEFSDIPPHNNMKVGPVGLGEPLLYPRFVEVVKLLRDAMPYAFIHANTNGISMNKNMCEKLVDSGLDSLIISINAHDRAVYKKLAGVDKFNIVVENIKFFLKIKGSHLPSVHVQMLDMDVNKPFLQAFSDFWTPHLNDNDTVYFRPFGDWGGLIRQEDFVSQRGRRKRFPCPALFSLIVIDKDGFVYPCCMGVPYGSESDLCLGNIMDKGIKQMYLRENKIWRLRKLHKRSEFDKIDACEHCGDWANMKNIFFNFAGKWV